LRITSNGCSNGVTFEDVGAQPDAEIVQSNGAAITVDGQALTALTLSAGVPDSQDYGLVVGRAFD
jgi:hypothetical protein